MAQSSNNFSDTLNGLFKEVYAKEIKNLVPDALKLVKMIDFLPKDKTLGNQYHQPVIVAQEQGLTFAASTDDAFTLNAAVAGQLKDAVILGNACVLKSVLGYNAASRAGNGGAQSFMNATKYLVRNMLESVSKAIEVEMLYGTVGYGAVGSTAGNVVTIATAEFASGIWSGSENMPIEFRDSTGANIRGQANITQTNISNMTITVDLLPAGVVATDIIWRKGAYGNEFAGLHAIISNTGTLFGINAAQYNLWQGNTYSAGSASLSLAKVERAIAKAVGKGLQSDVVLLLNPTTWADMLVEQTALRQFDSSYKTSEMDNGSRTIKFYGQNGMIEVMPSIYVKQGYAYIFVKEELVRVGSTDITFERPGAEGKFFRDLETAAGYELRCYTDQALLCIAPGHTVLINQIVNNS